MQALWRASSFDDSARQYQLARCRNCGLASTQGIDTELLAEAYDAEYYGSGSKKFSAALEFVLGRLTDLRATFFLKLLRKEEPRVLDIGCGRGLLLEAFKRQGAKVVGIERDEFPDRPEYVHVGSLNDAEFDSQKFDLVVIWHVLEHLESMQETLDQVAERLSENGVIAIAIPNFGSWQSLFFRDAWFHLDLPRHVLHIEVKQLVNALLARNLEVVRINHFDPVQNLYGFIQSAMNLLKPDRNNAYYKMLKHGADFEFLPFIGWSLLAVVFAPFALLEMVLTGIQGQGATVQVIAKRVQ